MGGNNYYYLLGLITGYASLTFGGWQILFVISNIYYLGIYIYYIDIHIRLTLRLTLSNRDLVYQLPILNILIRIIVYVFTIYIHIYI